MKVAVANAQVPFLYGGAEVLADSLVAQLRARGIDAYLIKIPFTWQPSERVLDHMLAARLLRLGNIDRLIPLKFPAYALPHDNKVVWLLHQFRQAYDLWGTPFQDIPDTPDGERIRTTIKYGDETYLAEARRLYTNSEVTRDRLKRFNDIDAEVLYPPLHRPEIYSCRPASDYVFCPSRICAAKRQTLIVEAMAHVRRSVRLVLAGPPDTPGDLRNLEQTVRRLGLGDRVQIMPQWITEEQKAELFADALGCVYIPVDEDSYGYVTLESFQARKPVITCSDSGGTRTVVIDGETGWVVPPDASAIGAAINQMTDDRTRAQALGDAGHEHVHTLGISWDRVITELIR